MNQFSLIILSGLILPSSITYSPKRPLVSDRSIPISIMKEIIVPMPPKMNGIDWQASLLPMVKQIISVESVVSDGSILLVNTMKNSTNGSLQTGKATVTLTQLITQCSNKFKVIHLETVNTARQTLGLSIDDSLESRSKAIGLARYLKAQYVLYSMANGEVKHPEVELQLILVKTGEIIWSHKKAVKKT